jgi:hypothetical protein
MHVKKFKDTITYKLRMKDSETKEMDAIYKAQDELWQQRQRRRKSVLQAT